MDSLASVRALITKERGHKTQLSDPNDTFFTHKHRAGWGGETPDAKTLHVKETWNLGGNGKFWRCQLISFRKSLGKMVSIK